MKSLRLLALAAMLATFASDAHSACPPAKLVLSTIREARSAQWLRLAPRQTRILDWDSANAESFLGCQVVSSGPVLPARAAALAKVLASPASYDCKAERKALSPTARDSDVGYTFQSDVAAVRVVLHIDEGQVELEFFNGAYAQSELSAAGRKSIERLFEGGGEPRGKPASKWAASRAGSDIDVLGYPVDPIMPIEMTAEGTGGVDLTGTVQLNVLVNVSGNVDSVLITNSIPTLDGLAIAAVRGRKFHPSKFEGKPVPSWIPIPVKFKIH